MDTVVTLELTFYICVTYSGLPEEFKVNFSGKFTDIQKTIIKFIKDRFWSGAKITENRFILIPIKLNNELIGYNINIATPTVDQKDIDIAMVGNVILSDYAKIPRFDR